jgi:hypothetical protein
MFHSPKSVQEFPGLEPKIAGLFEICHTLVADIFQ